MAAPQAYKPTQQAVHGLLHKLPARHVEARRIVGTSTIGGGSYGAIHPGEMRNPHDKSTSIVAIKMLRTDRHDVTFQDIERRLLREVEVWIRLGSHGNVLPLIGVCTSPDLLSVGLVMPLISEGNLTSYLKRHQPPKEGRYTLIWDVAQGLKHLHDNQIVHGDLKAENVLVNAQGRAILCDFGMSSFIGEEAPTTISSTLEVGTVRWMAPERLDPETFKLNPTTARTPASDRFSMGMTIYEIITCLLPFGQVSEFEAWNRILRGITPTHPGPQTLILGLTDMLWHFLKLCWQVDRFRRPSFEDLRMVLTESHPTIMSREITARNLIEENTEQTSDEFQTLLQGETVPVFAIYAPQQVMSFDKEGSLCRVQKALLAGNGRLVAVKSFRNGIQPSSVFLQLYGLVAQDLTMGRHPNILPVLGISPVWEYSQFHVLYDYMKNGTLEDLLTMNGFPGALDELSILHGVASGLSWLHSQGISHGEPIPANILLNNEFQPVLRSFSFRINLDQDQYDALSTFGRLRATPYLPPESLGGKGKGLATSSKAGDVYSFAMTAYHTLLHAPPYGADFLDLTLHTKIKAGRRPALPARGQGGRMTLEIQRYIKKSWESKPIKRPTIDEFFPTLPHRSL